MQASESTNQVVPCWSIGIAHDDRIVEVFVRGDRVVALGESGTKYAIGYVDDIWPLPKGSTA